MINYTTKANGFYELTNTYEHRILLPGVPLFAETLLGHESQNTLTFKPGFIWDGPSGPALDTVNGMRASLVHDGLYTIIKKYDLGEEYRKVADKELYKIAREDGMSWWRAAYWYLGVRIGGWLSV